MRSRLRAGATEKAVSGKALEVTKVKGEEAEEAALEDFFRGTVSAPMRPAIARARERGGGPIGGLPLAEATRGGTEAAEWAVATAADGPPGGVWRQPPGVIEAPPGLGQDAARRGGSRASQTTCQPRPPRHFPTAAGRRWRRGGGG